MSARPLNLFYLTFALIVLPFIVIVTTITNAHLFNVKPFVVVSGSMEPVIPTGSIIYTKKKDVYKAGDIITFLQEGSIISHRIVESLKLGKEIYFSTKGDSNKIVDLDLVNIENVYGSVMGSVPIIGRLVIFFKTPWGLIFATALPMILFLAFYKEKYS